MDQNAKGSLYFQLENRRPYYTIHYVNTASSYFFLPKKEDYKFGPQQPFKLREAISG